MAGNTVQITFAGDSKSLERTFSSVGSGAKGMASDMDKAGGQVKSFGSTVDSMNDSIGSSEGKFMGAADLLDGLGGAFGLPTEGVTNLARSFGDLAGGFESVIGPAISKVAGMLGFQTAATGAQTAATGAATGAQTGLNAALAANPIGLVVLAIAGLVGAFVLAWKHSETFRDIVRGALDTVKGVATGLWDFFKSLPDKLWGITTAVKDAILWPYKTAFNEVARLWNNTVGQLSFSVPDWVPGLGGKGFSMPKLPTFHQGGIVPGNPGQAIPILAMAGETVIPAGRGGTTVVVNFNGVVGDPTAAARQIDMILRQARDRGVIPA